MTMTMEEFPIMLTMTRAVISEARNLGKSLDLSLAVHRMLTKNGYEPFYAATFATWFAVIYQ